MLMPKCGRHCPGTQEGKIPILKSLKDKQTIQMQIEMSYI